jgi:hypothetical protein
VGPPIAPAFPLGVYASCTNSTVQNGVDEGTPTTGVVGGDGPITLTAEGGVVTATLGDGLLATGSFAFTLVTPTTGVSAPGQSFSTTSAIGGGDVSVGVSSGALAFTGGVLVLSVAGSPDATASVFSCAAPSGPAVPADPADPSSAFPDATFDHCASVSAGGGGNSAGYPAGAAVSVTLHDGVVTAVANGQSSPSGTFALTATSDGTASLVPGQSAESSCFEFADAGFAGGGSSDASFRPPPDPTPVSVPLSGVAGALVLQGSSLFLDITGSDECSKAAVLAIVCTEKH